MIHVVTTLIGGDARATTESYDDVLPVLRHDSVADAMALADHRHCGALPSWQRLWRQLLSAVTKAGRTKGGSLKARVEAACKAVQPMVEAVAPSPKKEEVQASQASASAPQGDATAAADTASASATPEFMPLPDWQRQFVAKSADVSQLTLVRFFQASVQQFLYAHVLQDPLGERGWKDLKANVHCARPKDLKITSDCLPTVLDLYFLGTVTRVPSLSSLPLCKAFGHQFYMDGSPHTRPDTDNWMPAWAVPQVDPAKVKPTLELRTMTLDYEFKYLPKPLATPKTEKVKVTLLHLAPSAAAVGKEVELTRLAR